MFHHVTSNKLVNFFINLINIQIGFAAAAAAAVLLLLLEYVRFHLLPAAFRLYLPIAKTAMTSRCPSTIAIDFSFLPFILVSILLEKLYLAFS